MPYYPTTEQLIEDTQNYLDADPRFFDQDEGCFTWRGRVVMFWKSNEDITLCWDTDSITFPRP